MPDSIDVYVSTQGAGRIRPSQQQAIDKAPIHVTLHQEIEDSLDELDAGLNHATVQVNAVLADHAGQLANLASGGGGGGAAGTQVSTYNTGTGAWVTWPVFISASDPATLPGGPDAGDDYVHLDPSGASGGTVAIDDVETLSTVLAGKVDTSRAVLAGPGLTGGGNLTANRTLQVNFGTTTNTVAAGDDARIVGAAQRALTKRPVSGAYTLVASDAVDVVLHITASAALTITLPTDAAAAIPVDVPIPWRVYGAGVPTFTAASGATLVSRGNAFKAAGQYAEGIVTKVSANTWLLSGDITT